MTIRFDSQTRARIAADLRQHYASGDVEAIAQRYGLTAQDLRMRANRLGLHRDPAAESAARTEANRTAARRRPARAPAIGAEVKALLAQIRREARAHRVELDGVLGVVHLPAVRGAAVRVHLAGEW